MFHSCFEGNFVSFSVINKYKQVGAMTLFTSCLTKDSIQKSVVEI